MRRPVAERHAVMLPAVERGRKAGCHGRLPVGPGRPRPPGRSRTPRPRPGCVKKGRPPVDTVRTGKLFPVALSSFVKESMARPALLLLLWLGVTAGGAGCVAVPLAEGQRQPPTEVRA